MAGQWYWLDCDWMGLQTGLHSHLLSSGAQNVLSGWMLLLAGPWVQVELQAGPHNQAGPYSVPEIRWGSRLYPKVDQGCRLTSAVGQGHWLGSLYCQHHHSNPQLCAVRGCAPSAGLLWLPCQGGGIGYAL